MIVRAKMSALKESRWYEYLIRFLLGGMTTLAAGIIADYYGPSIGGLFLAFPAIFCASVWARAETPSKRTIIVVMTEMRLIFCLNS
jgi:hypothetical protein